MEVTLSTLVEKMTGLVLDEEWVSSARMKYPDVFKMRRSHARRKTDEQNVDPDEETNTLI